MFSPAAPPEHLPPHRLAGSGLGWVDLHLLASALVSSAQILTLDRALRRLAARIGVAA
jgi:predicted nucleic acid-binding protein